MGQETLHTRGGRERGKAYFQPLSTERAGMYSRGAYKAVTLLVRRPLGNGRLRSVDTTTTLYSTAIACEQVGQNSFALHRLLLWVRSHWYWQYIFMVQKTFTREVRAWEGISLIDT